MRWMPAVAAVFVIAGCGSGVAGQAGGAPITPDHPAPPIVAADETPPDDIQQFLKWDFEPDDASSTDDQLGQSSADLVCTQSGSSAVTTDCPQPSPEETAKAQAEDEQYTHAISPAAGSEPVVVAKLELGAGQELFFTEWTATTGDPCWEIDEEGPDGGGGGGPSGPCSDAAVQLAFPDESARMSQYAPPCTDLCLESDSSGGADPSTEDFRLAGTVPADAEALRVTVAGGGTATYPLVGPRLSDPSLRVFMVDLGNHDWRTLELIRKGSVASTVTMPTFRVTYEDCELQVGPMPVYSPTVTIGDVGDLQKQLEPYNTAMDRCLGAKGFP